MAGVSHTNASQVTEFAVSTGTTSVNNVVVVEVIILYMKPVEYYTLK